jgi:hypothetical protein
MAVTLSMLRGIALLLHGVTHGVAQGAATLADVLFSGYSEVNNVDIREICHGEP